MGLTGIEFLGPNQEVIPLSYDMLKVGEANLLIVSLSLPHSFLFIKTCRIFRVLFFLTRLVQGILMISQNTKMTIEHLISKYLLIFVRFFLL